MHAKDTLTQLKEWVLNGTINGETVSAQAAMYLIDKTLALPSDINEAEVHKAIKPHLSPTLQGKVMGALRQVLDMYQPSATQHSIMHRHAQVHSAVITLMQDEVDNNDDIVASIAMRKDLWKEVIEAVKRDRQAAQALRYAGLHMVQTAHGYAVKPMQKIIAQTA